MQRADGEPITYLKIQTEQMNICAISAITLFSVRPFAQHFPRTNYDPYKTIWGLCKWLWIWTVTSKLNIKS